MTQSSFRIRAQSYSSGIGVEWQVGGEDLVKEDKDADEEEKWRLRSRSEEVIHAQYTVHESRISPYGYGNLSIGNELRASTRHGFKGAPQKNLTMVKSANTGLIVLYVTIFAFSISLLGMWIMPTPAVAPHGV